MRRTFAAAVLATAVAAAMVPASPSTAADGATPEPPLAEQLLAQGAAQQALEHAQAVLSGTTGAAPGSRVEGTLALRNLFAALPDLSDVQRQQARSVLARPTDGNRDPYGDGYTVAAKKKCAGHFCIHWVPTTSDAPPGRGWVNTTLDTMNQVWRTEIGRLGYRKPVRDGLRGGNGLLDVYLKDVGDDGLYGYCAPEYVKPHRKREASGYCVLDNDYARSQFGTRPINSLRVTAAHEFFHAIQFGYDYKEDGWLMEATATWIEERFADDINDNRQYLLDGQVQRPAQSLDLADPYDYSVNEYGNWAFFEFLSSHYGIGVVRKIWNAAGEFPDGGHKYSTEAVRAVLSHHGGFKGVYTRFAAGNLTPGSTYAEGDAWKDQYGSQIKAPVDHSWTLSADSPEAGATLSVNHMAARNVVVRPDSTLSGTGWHGRLVVDGPDRATSPAVYVVVHRTSGAPIRKAVKLGRSGKGIAKFPLGASAVERVTITVVNASTRFDCGQGTHLSCSGKARDNSEAFDVKVEAVQG